MTDRERLLERSAVLLDEIKDMTPGAAAEAWLNRKYGPGTELYDTLARLITSGVEEGWAAGTEVAGRRYRRSRICEPGPDTRYFSVTAVYMESREVIRGDYHGHPYGEFNMIVPLDRGAVMAGPNGWCGAGWTAPAPGSHHYPEVKGGAVIALFFLPAGRISYDVVPDAAGQA